MRSLQLTVTSFSMAIVLGSASLAMAKEPKPMGSPMSSPMPPMSSPMSPMASPSAAETPRTAPSARLNASLAPSSEVPAVTINGKGTATVNLYSAQNKLCYRLSVSGLENVMGAHIHVGKAGKNGSIVIPLNTPGAKGIALGCVSVKSELLQAIARNPANYYINVHTKQYEKGAVRGQLTVANATMMKP